MARSRSIKPSYYMNEILAECEPLARILFSGLWTIADREGRLEDRPKKIKAELLPYDDCDCESLLTQLSDRNFITRYESGGNRFIQVVNFTKHQNPHIKEAESTIPAPCSHDARTIQDQHNDNPQEKAAPEKHGASTVQNVPLPLTLNPLIDSPSLHQDDAPTEFQKVFDAGIEIFPHLASKGTSVIQQWINSGCIPETDIIPELKRNAHRGPGSWSYFTQAVMDAKATRERPLPAGKPRAQQRKGEVRSNVTVL